MNMAFIDEFEFSEKLEVELISIFNYWKNNTIDHEFGGFLGRIDHNNNVIKDSPKGIVLNTRILWAFSRVNNFYGDTRFDEVCQRAFDYLYEHFRDRNYGGVYWEVDQTGKPSNRRKQIYAQAFCIYALSEYYKYSKNPKALIWALELYNLLEEKAFDKEFDGYIEAFEENWKSIQDLRLSEKDLNAPKTTNTHLHILEAYTTLFEVTKDSSVALSLQKLLTLFLGHIFNYNNHLKLFFTKDWKNLSAEISYGHDIEAAWLLYYGAKILGDRELIQKTETMLSGVSKTFVSEALDVDFGVWNSKDSETQVINKDKHWWPQAEAMVGMIYAWKITNDRSYYDSCLQIWDFVKNKVLDTENGEWFFRLNRKGEPYTSEDKVGPWKCPYHNSRALIEIISMLKA